MSQQLLKRFSLKQRELAVQIINDVAEDIDNGHTRKELRMAIAYQNVVNLDRDAEFLQQRSDLKLVRWAAEFIQLALKKKRTPRNKKSKIVDRKS